MLNYTNLKIIQKPVEVKFDCPKCEQEITVDFNEFGYNLTELFYDSVNFKCPLCNEILIVEEASLD